MGYYTRYELVQPDMSDELEDAIHYRDLEYALIDENEAKWYDHESDMRELSRRFPNTLFELHGEGEDSGDIWVKYFKNGKMQSCEARIEFDPYDESKLR